MSSQSGIVIRAGLWYTWEMLPGYAGGFDPYYSPIFVSCVEPLKTGKGLLRLGFYNAAYASGVRDFSVPLRVLKRTPTYMIAEIVDQTDRCAVISIMSFDWLARQFPEWLAAHPREQMEEPFRSSPHKYLGRLFRVGDK